MTTIEEIKEKRFQFLRKLYGLSGGDVSKGFDVSRIGEELGFDGDLTRNIVNYLLYEGLIANIGGGSVGITHWGIREVEDCSIDEKEGG